MFANDLRHFVNVIRYLETVYTANARSGSMHHMLCMKYANYTRKIFEIIPMLYFAASILFGLATIARPLYAGGVETPLLLYAPSISDDIQLDVPIFVINVVWLFHSTLIVCTYDMLIYMTFFNIPLLATIIVNEVHELERKLIEGHMTHIDVKRQLVRIIRMHEEYKEYVDTSPRWTETRI